MKKNGKQRSKKIPFASEIKEAKYEFIKMIDEMPDDEFIAFMFAFIDLIDYLDEYDENLDLENDDDILPF